MLGPLPVLRGDRGEETHNLMERWTHKQLQLGERQAEGAVEAERKEKMTLGALETTPPPRHTHSSEESA